MGRSLINSMLLKPINFAPFRSIPPYRELVLTIGSPIVFHTAPPQPASNARITCPAVLVGGPEASQNGLGLVIPANFTLRSAMSHLLGAAAIPAVPPARGAAPARPRHRQCAPCLACQSKQ